MYTAHSDIHTHKCNEMLRHIKHEILKYMKQDSQLYGKGIIHCTHNFQHDSQYINSFCFGRFFPYIEIFRSAEYLF